MATRASQLHAERITRFLQRPGSFAQYNPKRFTWQVLPARETLRVCSEAVAVRQEEVSTAAYGKARALRPVSFHWYHHETPLPPFLLRKRTSGPGIDLRHGATPGGGSSRGTNAPWWHDDRATAIRKGGRGATLCHGSSRCTRCCTVSEVRKRLRERGRACVINDGLLRARTSLGTA